MAERRFYFWESYAKAFGLLTDDEAGRFIKACCAFAFDGKEPDFSDSAKLEFAFGMVRGQLAASVEIGTRAAESGRKGGRPPNKTTAKSRAKTTPKTTAKSSAKTTPKSSAKSSAKSTPESSAESSAESDMNMKVNVGTAASLDGSASAPTDDGGDSDEY